MKKKYAKFPDIKQVTSVVFLVYLVIGIVLKIKLLRHNNKVLTFMLDKKIKKYLKANTSSWQKRYLMIIYIKRAFSSLNRWTTFVTKFSSPSRKTSSVTYACRSVATFTSCIAATVTVSSEKVFLAFYKKVWKRR